MRLSSLVSLWCYAISKNHIGVRQMENASLNLRILELLLRIIVDISRGLKGVPGLFGFKM